MSKHSPVFNLVQNLGIKVNPMSQKGFLKYALNKTDGEGGKDSDISDDDSDYFNFGSRRMIRPLKDQRNKELQELKALGKENIDDAGVIRLTNKTNKTIQKDPQTGASKV